MKKIKDFIIENRRYIAITFLIVGLVVTIGIPLLIALAGIFWYIAIIALSLI